MKKIIFTIVIAISSLVQAGDKIGNGGGVWACYSADRNLEKAFLVDLYEIQAEFKLKLMPTSETDPMTIFQERSSFMQGHLPHLFSEIAKSVDQTLANINFVDSELSIIDDALVRSKPESSTCATEWKYQQFANFTELHTILVSNSLWKSPKISAVDKAALIWHEIIYNWLRESKHDVNSVRARVLVGLLFSNLDATAMEVQIEQFLKSNIAPHPVAPGAESAKTLYVAAGSCYSGSGITTYAGASSSHAITKWNSEVGLFNGILTDFNLGSNTGLTYTPQSLLDDGESLLILTEENQYFRKRNVSRVNKFNPTVNSIFAKDPNAFSFQPNQIVRSMAKDLDGSIAFSKSDAVERISSLGARLSQDGINPWINPDKIKGKCFPNMNSFILQIAYMAPFNATNQGKLIYLSSGKDSKDNRIGIVQRTGLISGSAGDCAGGIPEGGVAAVAHMNGPGLVGPVNLSGTGASLTSMVYIPTPAPAKTSGKLVVSYSSSKNTGFDNNTEFNMGIVLWDINETSDSVATVTNPVIIYRDESVIWAPSAMTYDPATKALYVAVGGSPGVMNQKTQNFGYNIEKLVLDLNTPRLSRIALSNQPFIVGSSLTKCISSMVLAN